LETALDSAQQIPRLVISQTINNAYAWTTCGVINDGEGSALAKLTTQDLLTQPQPAVDFRAANT
jgi:hypothetical protein